MRCNDVVLVGAGLASQRCAETLRARGWDGPIRMIGDEPHAPYDRPPLSKSYLAGKQERSDALVLDPDWWEQNDVELLTRTSAMKLDLGERVAKLSNKEEVAFGKALLATGANVRRLRADGSDLDGIHYCARSATPMRSARTRATRSASCSSAGATSPARSPRRSRRSAPDARW